jgi:hypothetical protein
MLTAAASLSAERGAFRFLREWKGPGEEHTKRDNVQRNPNRTDQEKSPQQ